MLQRDDVRAGGRVVEVAERMPAKWLNSFDYLGRKEARVSLDRPLADTVQPGDRLSEPQRRRIRNS
jgi:hypothetical protein